MVGRERLVERRPARRPKVLRIQPGDIAKEVVNIIDDIKTLYVCTFILIIFLMSIDIQDV